MLSAMAQMRLYKKRIILVSIIAVICYLLFRVRSNSESFQVTIEQAKPIDVWEYVADFSHMKKLNPTILDFSIEAESGDYAHWRYSAAYTEHLVHAPFLQNSILAHFSVRSEGDSYIVHSTHETCFLGAFACLDSVSEFRFSAEGSGTRCVEAVTYECPAILGAFCRRELQAQRRTVMNNLHAHFLAASE